MATVTGTKRHLGITSDTYDSNGDVVVGGNLTVEGTTTTLDTANLLVEDKNIIIGNVSTPSDTTADGGGITLKGASDYTINWVNANDRWEFNQGIHSTGNITGANLSGTNTGNNSANTHSSLFIDRGSIDVTTSTGGSNANPFDDAHTETKVAENGMRTINYTGAGAFLYTFNNGGSASVVQLGAHYNGNDYYLRTRTDSSTWQTWKKIRTYGNTTIPTDFVSAANGGTFSGPIAVSDSAGAAWLSTMTNSANDGHGLLIQAGGTSGTRYITQWKDAAGTERFHMDDTGEAYFQNTIAASNFSGTSSGTNTGDQTLPTDFVSKANGGTFDSSVRFDGGVNIDSNTNSNTLNVSRSGGTTTQVMKIGVTDTAAIFDYIEDTTNEGNGNFGQYQFKLGGNDGESTVTALTITKTGISAPNLSGTNTGDQDLSGYLTSLPSHNHDDRYYTETEIDENLGSLMGWVPAYSNTEGSSVKWDFTEDALKIQLDTDSSTGASFKARRIISGERIRVTIMAKASAAASTGVYFRLYQHNGDMPDGKTHVSNDASNSSVLVQEDDAGVTNWHENSSITTDWVTYEKEYTAVADGYISLVVLNWTNLGTNSLYIKNPDIQTIKAATVTTNANLTGHVTSVGNATSLGSFTTAELNAAISDGTVPTDFVSKANGGTFSGALKITDALNSGSPILDLHNSTNGEGADIRFTDTSAGTTQFGNITYRHVDTKSYGSGASFTIGSSEASTTILADGKLMYNEGIYSKPATGTGAGTRKDGNWDSAYDHSQDAHAPANAEQNVQSDWNATSGDALILNKPSIPAASGKGQGINYIASNLPSSNSTYRDNFGAGVWAYSGYSTGANRPFTYDATLQIMPTANLGFELSTSWHSTGEGSLKIRALRDCCEGWGDYHDIWTSDNFANNSANWNTAYGWGDHASAGYIDSDSNYLKSNAADTFTGQLSVGSTDTRRAGIYGIYDSYKIGHIWSMGTGYMIPSNGSDFGNLYGLAYKHTNNTTGGTMAGGHQAVWATNGTPRAALGESGIWTSGNVTHSGLTMTDGTDIDQIKSYTKSLTLTTSWIDTGVNGSELATGTYIVQVTVDNHDANGSQYDEMYSGTMSWYASNTNSTNHDEIVLHAAGHARNNMSIYLRVLRTASADTNDLKLQISNNRNATATASNYIFKFRRMI